MYFNTNGDLELLKNQLEYLGKTTKDDCADIAATAVEHLTKPEVLEKYVESSEQPKQYKTLIQKFKETNNKPKSYRDTWII